jgi:hypothetical protein
LDQLKRQDKQQGNVPRTQEKPNKKRQKWYDRQQGPFPALFRSAEGPGQDLLQPIIFSSDLQAAAAAFPGSSSYSPQKQRGRLTSVRIRLDPKQEVIRYAPF